MKHFRNPLTLAFLAASLVPFAHATPINPLLNGFNFTVDGTQITDVNSSFDSISGKLTFTDQAKSQTYTFVGVSAPPLLNAISITRLCITANITGCSSSVVSVSNAEAAYGALQASVLLGASLTASANVNTSNLTFSSVVKLGTESALVGYPNAGPSPNPTPEPGSLVLLSTGLLSAAGVARRRLK